MTFPRPSLSSFVKCLLENGNAKHTLNLERLCQHNIWIPSVEALAAEFDAQEMARSLTPCPEVIDG